METRKQINLVVERSRNYDSETIGNLFVMNHELNAYDYDNSWYTLENSKKLIPAGVYPYRLIPVPATSKWYGKQNYLIQLDVNDDYVRGFQIHVGNSVKDTNGCILIGMELNDNEDRLVSSQPAYNSLVGYLQSNNLQRGYIQVVENYS